MTPLQKCAVRHCRYIAESALDGFVVCALHDAQHVLGILDRLMAPAAYYGSDDRPIVLPCGPLLESDFESRDAAPDAVRAGDCPRLAAVPDGPSKMTYPLYDLTRDL